MVIIDTIQKAEKEFEDKYSFIFKLGIQTKERFEEVKAYYVSKVISQI